MVQGRILKLAVSPSTALAVGPEVGGVLAPSRDAGGLSPVGLTVVFRVSLSHGLPTPACAPEGPGSRSACPSLVRGSLCEAGLNAPGTLHSSCVIYCLGVVRTVSKGLCPDTRLGEVS